MENYKAVVFLKIDEKNVGESIKDGLFTLLRDVGKLQVSDKFDSMVFPMC